MQNKQSLPELLARLGEEQVEKVKLAIADVDGILRGKVIGFDKFQSVASAGFGFCDVVFGWDAADRAYDNGVFTGWHTGYPDAVAVVDVGTMRRVPWEGGLPFFLADLNGGPVCPRSLLKRVIAQVAAAGYSAYFSQEFEWFNFIAPAVAGGAPTAGGGWSFGDLKPMTQGMFGYSILRASQGSGFFHDLFDSLKAFGVPLEGLHTETGPGVYEAAILYTDVLEAADRAVLFKTAVKEIGHRHGILPTFMAKISADLPGCSGHVHQSLWTADGSRNLFYDEGSPTRMSPLMESYLAGQLHCLPYILPMVAPTVNSYKRLVEGAWAPTTLTWGIDNRTVALRALPGGEKSTRLETRVVGSDTNPYLAMAACLAAGLYGIQEGLRLSVPATKGNGYAEKQYGVLPRNLWEATQAMRQSPIAIELFGREFVDHFVRTREWEWRQFGQAVTDWELQRYLEII
ncbi:MAG TPA: glutamine synthetase [Puia sp.]|nr:glutamine synthetase [Puia sp.]